MDRTIKVILGDFILGKIVWKEDLFFYVETIDRVGMTATPKFSTIKAAKDFFVFSLPPSCSTSLRYVEVQ